MKPTGRDAVAARRRTRDRRASLRQRLIAAAAGVATAGSVPPFGWWPLGIVGLGMFFGVLCSSSTRRQRFSIGFSYGLAHYAISLWWMTQFSLPGGIFVAWLETMHVAAAVALLIPNAAAEPARSAMRGVVGAPSAAAAIAFPSAMVAADAVRSLWPFGGLPLGGLDLGQASGPLAPLVTFGGRLLLIGVVSAFGVCCWTVAAAWRQDAAVRRGRVMVSGVVLAVLVGTCALARGLPDGTRRNGTVRMAMVQGGGPRGLRADAQNAQRTYNAHVAGTGKITTPVDVILWPEDVFDVPTLRGSAIERQLSRLAMRHRAVFLPGGVEDSGPGRFRNFTTVFEPDGRRGMDFQKVRRVPYGEYFWGRGVIESLGLATLPERDAEAGRNVGVIRTSVASFAIAISYEGFFDDRARGGVRAGGEAVLIPTNASSYVTAQVPSQQIAAARLRARETGRWVVQLAPTGFSGVIDHRGRLLKRTAIGEAETFTWRVERRLGLTPYARWNDAPALVLWALLLAASHLFHRARRCDEKLSPASLTERRE